MYYNYATDGVYLSVLYLIGIAIELKVIYNKVSDYLLTPCFVALIRNEMGNAIAFGKVN